MSKAANKQAATQAHTPAHTPTLREVRIALVGAAYRARARNDKLAKHARAQQHAKHAIYQAAATALAQQFGVALPTPTARRVAGAGKHTPSNMQGACAQVHALAALHNGARAATLAACAVAGINPATAATQYQRWKKMQQVQIPAEVNESAE